MATLSLVNSQISFQVVNPDGTALQAPEDYRIETVELTKSPMKIYHLFVKFDGQDKVTEWTVAAKSQEFAFRIINAIGHEAKEIKKPEAFDSFYEAAKKTSISAYAEKDHFTGGEKIQLHTDSILRSFGNRFYEPIHRGQNHTQEHMTMLTNYARLFNPWRRENEREYADFYLDPIDDAEQASFTV